MRALVSAGVSVAAGAFDVASRMSAGVWLGVTEEVAGTAGGTRSEERDMLGIVGRVEATVEGKKPGMLGIGAIPGRLRGGRDSKPAEKQKQHSMIRSRLMYRGLSQSWSMCIWRGRKKTATYVL